MARSRPSGWFSQSERRHARSSSHGVGMRGTSRHRRHNVVRGHVVSSLFAFALETTVTVTVTVTVTAYGPRSLASVDISVLQRPRSGWRLVIRDSCSVTVFRDRDRDRDRAVIRGQVSRKYADETNAQSIRGGAHCSAGRAGERARVGAGNQNPGTRNAACRVGRDGLPPTWVRSSAACVVGQVA